MPSDSVLLMYAPLTKHGPQEMIFKPHDTLSKNEKNTKPHVPIHLDISDYPDPRHCHIYY